MGSVQEECFVCFFFANLESTLHLLDLILVPKGLLAGVGHLLLQGRHNVGGGVIVHGCGLIYISRIIITIAIYRSERLYWNKKHFFTHSVEYSQTWKNVWKITNLQWRNSWSWWSEIHYWLAFECLFVYVPCECACACGKYICTAVFMLKRKDIIHFIF